MLADNESLEHNEAASRALMFLSEYLLCILAEQTKNPKETMDTMHAQLIRIASKNKPYLTMKSPSIFEQVVTQAATNARKRLAEGIETEEVHSGPADLPQSLL